MAFGTSGHRGSAFEGGWFAARSSGTEDVYKLYAESFKGSDHLRRIQEEAQAIIQRVFRESVGAKPT